MIDDRDVDPNRLIEAFFVGKPGPWASVTFPICVELWKPSDQDDASYPQTYPPLPPPGAKIVDGGD